MQKLFIEPQQTYPSDSLPCDKNATNSYIPDHEYDIVLMVRYVTVGRILITQVCG